MGAAQIHGVSAKLDELCLGQQACTYSARLRIFIRRRNWLDSMGTADTKVMLLEIGQIKGQSPDASQFKRPFRHGPQIPLPSSPPMKHQILALKKGAIRLLLLKQVSALHPYNDVPHQEDEYVKYFR